MGKLYLSRVERGGAPFFSRNHVPRYTVLIEHKIRGDDLLHFKGLSNVGPFMSVGDMPYGLS